ncbi:MAG: hypothetical protein LAO31_15175 [Acidobacteriia bacterium]|nr:hypothetical protein [Terriglobia bacterium]
MRVSFHLIVVSILASWILPTTNLAQKQTAPSPKILSATSVYFDDRTGDDAVGNKALAQLNAWGRFQIVQDRKQADLILLLSADPYKGGYIIMSGGQTGTIDSQGKIQEDRIPNYNRLAPVRYAYLTVIDPKTGENLWSVSHRWGGLLTGFNSVGERLIRELEKQTRK